jgi:regulator of sigma E protease
LALSDLLLFLVVLGTLILGHELGHFVAARLRGIKVEEFGIGFPPRLLTLFEAGGTKYTLNWIPLGGFVRPAGEDDPDVPGGLAGSSKLTRTIVLIAGPAANVLLAFFAFLFAFRFAAPDLSQVIIAEVTSNTPAYEAGILEGDKILKVDGTTVSSFQSIQEIIAENLGEELGILIERDGQESMVYLTPRIEWPEDQGPIGVTLGYPLATLSWGEAALTSLDSMRAQVVGLLQLPGRLISGEASEEEARISGLKGIHDMLAWASAVDRSSERPFITLNIVGVISLGLALANLLPIPALDGGRLMFVLIEALIGRRISPRFEGLAHAVGFMFLLILMVYFNLQDFINPISLP